MKKLAAYGVATGVLALASVGIFAGLMSNSARADESTPAQVSELSANSDLAGRLIDETVYVFLGADGHVKKTISSDWTKNDLGADIYTKTEGNVSAPIDVKISYYLDGKKISADELRGRTGHIKIRYDYTNTERVNGVYMPYAVLSGMMLSNEKFSNISVKNAKLMNDGSRTTIIGVALPGMKENLGVNIDIPEYVEVEADAKEFKMEMTATIATSKIFAELDVSALDSVEALSSQLNTLASSMAQLMDGSVKLRDGLATLNDESGALADGISQLRAGSLKLTAGAGSLSDGIKTAATGAGSLSNGLDSAYNGSKTLSENINKAAAGAAKIDAGVGQLSDKVNEIAAKINSLQTIEQTLRARAENVIQEVQTRINELLAEHNLPELSDLPAITLENIESAVTRVANALAGIGQVEKAQRLSEIAKKLNIYQDIKNDLAGMKQELASLSTAPEAIAELKKGTSELASGLKTMDGEVKTNLVGGLNQLSTGAKSLSDGLNTAYSGSKELAAGMANLDSGIDTLYSNVPALTSGVAQLADGSSALSDGLSMFNEQGVQRLISLYNGNVRALVSRIQSIVNTAKNANQKIKYIYRTEEI